MEVLFRYLARAKEVLDYKIFTLGAQDVTLWTLIQFLVLVFLLFYLTSKVRNLLVNRLLVRGNIDVGLRQALGTLVRYVMLGIGLVIILQTVGIDLTALNVLAGAIGIGVGFGLQNIASNFISGLIILFERPIKIGDRIEVGNVDGDVVKIGARSTTVLTNDNIAIIVPNTKFVTENVVNWSYNDPKVRFKIPISVAYGSDVRLVEKLLLEVASEEPAVLDDPRPGVRFLEFGDSGLHFELRAWSTKLLHKKGMLISALNFAINDKFKKHGVEIPFPQRDLHLRSAYIDIERLIAARAGKE